MGEVLYLLYVDNAKISSAHYSRQKRTFTFDNYVEAHQEAHKTLADLNEPVPETKKVTDFLAGITDLCLSNVKDLILGDTQKLQSFKICQQYLKTLVYNKSTQEKHERQISGLDRQRDGGKVRRTSDASPGKTSGITARMYTHEEWSKLSKEEREKVKELRKLRKTKNRGSPSRRASAIQVDSEEDSDDSSYSVSSTSERDQKTGNVSSTAKDGASIPISGAGAGPPTWRSGKSYQS
jgi:hypothetical protein